MVTFSMLSRNVVLASSTILAGIGTASASETLGSSMVEGGTWKQSFIGCAAGSTPFFEASIFADDAQARPLVKIGDMQAWSVLDENGEPELRLTTEDGLTIIGRVIGPQGEDISGALLGTVPTVEAPPSTALLETADEQRATNTASIDGAATSAPPAIDTVLQTAEPAVPNVAAEPPATPAPASSMAATSTAFGADVGPLAQALAATAAPAQSPTPLQTTAAEAAPAWDQPQPVAQTQPEASPDQIVLPPAAQTPEQLLMQTSEYAVWFSLGERGDDIPVVYMMVDPLCPYCAEAVKQLAPHIESGKLDVRLVPMPILSMDSFTTMVSLIQGGNPAEDFLAHELAFGTSKPHEIDLLAPEEFDEQLKTALYRNAMWFKKNQIGAVPFFIYRDATGVQTVRGLDGFSPEAMLKADPMPMPPANVAAAPQAAATQDTATQTEAQ